jgi:4-hydroxymandelate oxidase
MLPDRDALVLLAARIQDSGFEALCLTVDRAYKPRRPADLSYPRPKNSLPVAATDPSFTWRDVSTLVSSIDIPLVVKGISHPADVRLAVESGAAAIVVSNHGGNQLDGACATLEVISEISAAAEGRIDVLMDGGVRCGPDVVKALALGARAVGIGRPLMWGLAHSGARGVSDILTILRLELIDTLGLLGVASVTAVSRDVVRRHGCGCV